VLFTSKVLRPGERTTVTVRFAPSDPGASTGQLVFKTIQCDASLSVPLRGSRQGEVASISPAGIDFGSDPSCRAARRDTTIVVKNSGPQPLTLTSAIIVAPFSIVSPSLPRTIAPGDSLRITVRAAPTVEGTYDSDLLLPFTNGPCSDTLRLGLQERYGRALFNNHNINFGQLKGCVETADTVITLSNDGVVDASIVDIAIPNNFVFVDTPPDKIPAGTSVQVRVRYRPTALGLNVGRIVARFEPCSDSIVIPIRGRKSGIVYDVPDTLDFGEFLDCGVESLKKLALTMNTEDGADGSISEVRIDGPFRTSIVAGSVLPQNTDTSFDVWFGPSADGAFTGSLEVVLAPCGVTRRVTLIGRRRGVAFSINGDTDFDSLFPGTIAERSLVVLNSSTVPSRVDSIVVAAPFTIVSTTPSLPRMLQPGDSIVVRTRFRARVGLDTTDLKVFASSPCDLRTQSTLTGFGDDRSYCRVYIPYDTAAAGELVDIQLKVDSSLALDPAGAREFVATISLDQSLLYPQPGREMTTAGGRRQVTINGIRIDSSDVLASIPMTAMLGRADSTSMRIDSFAWVSTVVPVITTRVDGLFTLEGVCREGGDRRYLRTGQVMLRPIVPNPVNGVAVVEFELTEIGRTRMLVYDSHGQQIATPLDSDWSPGHWVVPVDLTDLPIGVYLLVMQTPTLIMTQTFEVTR
ncbi:MAG: choice-of-anchor D domain-containing protein, partial [bacterium]|nr:choice-of-anchor D domain-containing protein [Candidatus Kapabacteria bacterium]